MGNFIVLTNRKAFPRLTCAGVITRFVHFAFKQLQADDGVDGDHEEHQQGDVKQWQHGLENGAHHHLQAWRSHYTRMSKRTREK